MPESLTSSGLLSRRSLMGLGGLTAAASLAACASSPGETAGSAGSSSSGSAAATESTAHKAVKTPADALARLTEGNARFAAGKATHPDQSLEARRKVVPKQHPYALVHSCVDSRVVPELVFDQGVGDLFVTRNGGNVLDDTIIGSIEFGISKNYAVPVVVIMGHTGCGAATAALKAVKASPSDPSAPGYLDDIIDAIAPVARTVPPNPDQAALVNAVVQANARSVASNLLRRSAAVRAAVTSGKTQVVPAVYDLGTGKVTWLPAAR